MVTKYNSICNNNNNCSIIQLDYTWYINKIHSKKSYVNTHNIYNIMKGEN